MKRIETENFILVESVLDSNGDSTWVVTEKTTKKIFYIHVFNVNHINIKLFSKSKINNPSEAISALCNAIVSETGKVPHISIHYTNKALIACCTKAGFRKVKKIKHLYTFKVKSIQQERA